MVERLEDVAPIDVRGVAAVRLLVHDGGHALHSPRDDEDLERALQRAIEAMNPMPSIGRFV